ncbi:MAG: SMC family ATPase [Syntrophobacterales bacterium]|nr:MAG: SMC family ATPase [Syntrophobacterales bacterium]
MILRELRLKNYRRFKEVYISDFPESVIAILGRNGIGKSSIFEAISWVLFGSTVFRTDKADVKRQGAAPEEPCEVDMVFSLRGNDYEVLREIRGKNNIVRASAWAYDNGTKKIVANSERGVSEHCQKILGMDWQTFQASVFSQQKDLDAFSQQTPAERQRIIRRLLAIDRIDMAITAIRRDKNDAQSEIRGVESAQKDIGKLREELRALREKKRILDEEERVLGERVARMKEGESEAKGEKEKWDKLERQFEKYSRHFALLGQEKGSIVQRKGEIESSLEEIGKLESELAGYEGKDGELRGLRMEQRNLQREQVKKAKRDGLEHNIQTCTKRIEGLKEDLAGLRRDLEAFETLDKRIEDHSEKLGRCSEEQEKALDTLGRVKGTIESIEREIEILSRQMHQIHTMGPDGRCPICMQTLGENYGKTERHLRGETKEKRETLTKLLEERDRFQAQVDQLNKDQQELLRSSEKLKEEEYHRGVILSQGREKEGHIREMREQCESYEKAIREIGEVDFDEDRYREIEKLMPELEHVEDRMIEIRAKVERKARFRRDLMGLEKRLEDLVESMDKKSRERDALGFDEGKYRVIKERLEKIRETRDRLYEERSSTRERRAKIRAEIAGKRREISHEKGLRDRIKLLQESVRYLDVLADIFVSFRMDLMGRMRPLLESRTSQLLSLISDGRYSVVELDEDYNIFIYDGNEKFKIQRFSGGEQDIFNLCLRIAVSQIVADRSGGEINFIALDEIFGSQDAERRENILRIFNGLSSQFRQIFLITHIEEMKDMMPVAWSVEEVSEGLSTVIT